MKDGAEVEKAPFVKKIDNPGKGRRGCEIQDNRRKSFWLTVCDRMFVSTVVVVNVIGFWRGLFGIFAQFHNPYHLFFLFLLGSSLLFQFTFARNAYKKNLTKKSSLNSLLRKGYTYVCGSACVMQWAGLWFYLDEMSGYDVYPPLTYSVICSAILIFIKMFRNVLSSPLTFSSDQLHEFFEFKTVFQINLPEKLHPKRNGLETFTDLENYRWCRGNLNEFGMKIGALKMTSSKSRIDSTLSVTPRDNKYLFSVLDTVLSSAVIAPAVIAYWRGTWYLLDIIVFPRKPEVSLLLSVVVGTLMQLMFALAQEILEKHLSLNRHKIIFYIMSRLYTYVYGIACVNMWRGGYKVLEFYSGTDVSQVVVTTVVSLLVLAAMKTMRNLSSAPFAVALDMSKGYFQVPTMFKLTPDSDTSLYVLDCFFSVFVIGSLVVFVWRGVWCLTDIFLYPDNDKYSAFGSLAIGYCIVTVVFSLQNPMESLCGKLTGVWRILAADVYVFVSFIGTINLWRGFWNLLNMYFLPDFPLLSCCITHVGSFLFLVLINCSNSVLVRGVYLDGEENSKCITFPISYLRLLFEEHLQKSEVKSSNQKITSLMNLSGDIEKGLKENSENSKNQILSNDSSLEIKP